MVGRAQKSRLLVEVEVVLAERKVRVIGFDKALSEE
jgi:hypothetical protein